MCRAKYPETHMYLSKERKETKLQLNIKGTAITKEGSIKKKSKNNLTNNKYKKTSIENYNRFTTTVMRPY